MDDCAMGVGKQAGLTPANPPSAGLDSPFGAYLPEDLRTCQKPRFNSLSPTEADFPDRRPRSET